MRSLILHSNKFESHVLEPSKHLLGIALEEKKTTDEIMAECLTVLYCIEKPDNDQHLQQLFDEIVNCATNMKVKNIMLVPFVHLSNNIASPNNAKNLSEKLVGQFQKTSFNIGTSHFGYNKAFLLDIKGHPCAYRYREFY